MGILVFIKKMYKKYQQVYQKFPSPMGIVIFIKDEKGSVLVEAIVRISVPYGDCSLYKATVKKARELYSTVSIPYGDSSLYKYLCSFLVDKNVTYFRPLWGF